MLTASLCQAKVEKEFFRTLCNWGGGVPLLCSHLNSWCRSVQATGMVASDLRQVGTTAWDSDRLKRSVTASTSWWGQPLITLPSGPSAFLMFTKMKILLTSWVWRVSSSTITASSVDSLPLSLSAVPKCAKETIDILNQLGTAVWMGGLLISSVLCDVLDALLHIRSLLSKWPSIIRSWSRLYKNFQLTQPHTYLLTKPWRYICNVGDLQSSLKNTKKI